MFRFTDLLTKKVVKYRNTIQFHGFFAQRIAKNFPGFLSIVGHDHNDISLTERLFFFCFSLIEFYFQVDLFSFCEQFILVKNTMEVFIGAKPQMNLER